MTAELYVRDGSRFVPYRERRPVPPIPAPRPVDVEPERVRREANGAVLISGGAAATRVHVHRDPTGRLRIDYLEP